MKLARINPETRMDNVKFDPRKELTEHAIDIGHYTCPHCNAVIEFKTSNFYKHFMSSHSNLSPKNLKYFNEFCGSTSIWEPFLDFECPGCKAPVRIHYEPWEFAMGSYGYTVTEIIEVKNWE